MLYQVLIIIHLIVALCLIGLVLIQQGKGADMGASFGAGSSSTVFGSSGSGNFLSKSTKWLAIGFFVISLVLGNLTANRVKATDEFDNLAATAAAVTESLDSIPSEAPKAIVVENSDVPSEDVVISAKESDVPQ